MFKENNLKFTQRILCAQIVLYVLSIIPSTTVLAAFHHVNSCGTCHIFFGTTNIKIITQEIQTPTSGLKPVVFTAITGPNSYADGDAVYDGVCEVCHTKTRHHRNDGSDNSAHFDGEDCSICHMHYKQFSVTYPKSHDIHMPTDGGRSMVCVDCHEETYQPQTILFTDGATFDTTGVCDSCHSPGGNYDGVNDPVIGAKSTWASGVYDANRMLLPGKEMWCAGCHDGDLSHAGNNVCTDCHNPHGLSSVNGQNN